MSLRYMRHVDGLRAWAVSLVILYHLDFSFFQTGFLGVDIFFVISGFLMARIITESIENDEFSFANFYLRRLKRLFPMLFLTVLLTTVASWFLLNPTHLENFGKSLLSTSLLSNNFLFYHQAGYFDTEAITKPLLHFWSLAVEEQFYLFFPIFLFSLSKFFDVKHHRLMCIFLLLLSLILAIVFQSKDSDLVFYMLPFRIWEFLLGALIIFFPNLNTKCSHLLTDFMFSIGCALVIMSIAINPADFTISLIGNLMACIGTALIICYGGRSRYSGLLENRLTVLIGKASYALYLVHWPVVVFFKYYFNRPYLSDFQTFLAIFVTVIISAFGMTYVENIWRNPSFGERVYSRNVGYYVSTAMVCIFAFGLFLSSSKLAQINLRYGEDAANFLRLGDTDFAREFYGGKACESQRPNPKIDFVCRFGSDSYPDFLVGGDSHVEALFAGLKKLADNNSLSFKLITEGTCGFFSPAKLRTDDQSCELARVEFMQEMAKAELVFLGQRWWVYQYAYNMDEKTFSLLVIDHLIKLIEKTGFSGKLILIGQIPEMPGYGGVYDCLSRFGYMKKTDCSKSPIFYDSLQRNKAINLFLADIIKERGLSKQIIFINPFKALCNSENCSQIIEPIGILYADSDHLTENGSTFFIQFFRDLILSEVRDIGR